LFQSDKKLRPEFGDFHSTGPCEFDLNLRNPAFNLLQSEGRLKQWVK
jgi:hypothetical protein